mgnify:CR=1 FL=1
MKFDFDVKKLLNLDAPYGKQLVTIIYYVMTAVIIVNSVVSFFAGIVSIAGGKILAGLGNIIFCLPLAIVYFLILRLVCEVINAVLDHCAK